MSFQVARLIGFYALAVVVLLASAVRINPTYRADAPLAFRRAAGLLLGGVVVVAGLSVQALALACLRPSGALELDPAAAAYLQGHAVTGRMLVWFDWGEYAIWHLPHLSVSIDGRRETVYSKAIIADHDEFYRNGPKARSYLEQLDPDYVWLRPDLPVSSQLQTWGWTPLFESPRSTVWLRPGGSTPATRPATPLPSCFPGP